jgi:hypothetical protein
MRVVGKKSSAFGSGHYLEGTTHMGIYYAERAPIHLQIFSDAN